jgi:hypothetical protein
MLCLLCRAGVAPDAVAKAEATDWLRSNRLVPSCDAEPVCNPERQEGTTVCIPCIALVKSRARLWHVNAKIVGRSLPDESEFCLFAGFG